MIFCFSQFWSFFLSSFSLLSLFLSKFLFLSYSLYFSFLIRAGSLWELSQRSAGLFLVPPSSGLAVCGSYPNCRLAFSLYSPFFWAGILRGLSQPCAGLFLYAPILRAGVLWGLSHPPAGLFLVVPLPQGWGPWELPQPLAGLA